MKFLKNQSLLLVMIQASIKNLITGILFSRIIVLTLILVIKLIKILILLSLTSPAIDILSIVYIQSIGSGIGLFVPLYQNIIDIFLTSISPVNLQSMGSEIELIAPLFLNIIPVSIQKEKNSYFRTHSISLNLSSIIDISPVLFAQVFLEFKKLILALDEIKKITLVRVLVQIKFDNNTTITLGNLINFDISPSGFDYFYKYISALLNDKIYGENNYKSEAPVAIIFKYHLEYDKTVKAETLSVPAKKTSTKDNLTKVVIKGHDAPNSKNIRHYGTMIKKSGNLYTFSKKRSKNEIFQITTNPDHNHVIFLFKGVTVYEFRDYFKVDANDFTFTRIYKNKEFYYENGRVLLATHVRPCRSFIPKQTTQKLSIKKIFTLDIETLKVNNILTPICIALASKSKT